MLNTILESLKGELARLEAEHAAWEAVYTEAEAAMRERLAGYNAWHTEVHRLKRAIACLTEG